MAATLELVQLDDKTATESGLDTCDGEAAGDATSSNNIDMYGGHRTLPPAGHRTLAKHDSSFRSKGSPLRWCTGCVHWSNW